MAADFRPGFMEAALCCRISSAHGVKRGLVFIVWRQLLTLPGRRQSGGVGCCDGGPHDDEQ